MAIKSRSDLEKTGVSHAELEYERQVFLQAIETYPSLSPAQKKMFRTDSELKGSYFGDLQDEAKQDLFEQKLGSSALRYLSSNKILHMIRNEAEHDLKTKGIEKPLAVASGRPLDVTNRQAFDHDGNLTVSSESERGISYSEDLSKLEDDLSARTVSPDDIGATVRTHSLGDTVTKTLYFKDRVDLFALDASAEFEHDGMTFGCATQAISYEQARFFGDSERALRVSAGPKTMAQMFNQGLVRNPYTSEKEREEWRNIREQVITDVLTSKYTTNDIAKEALIATKGYRLAYASDNAWNGIGVDIDDVSTIRQEAVKNNSEFVLKERRVDNNNLIGRVTEKIRYDLLNPEPELPDNFNPNSPYREMDANSSPKSNPFSGSQNPEQKVSPVAEQYVGFEGSDSHIDSLDEASNVSIEEDRGEYVGFSGYNPYMEDDVGEVKQSSLDVTPTYLEMSIHSGDELTSRGSKRAQLAVDRFVAEAINENKKAKIHIAKDAASDLKKAVWSRAKDSDSLEMVQLDINNIPNRSLIVQHGTSIPNYKVPEISAAANNGNGRDVRVLSVDPKEPEAYTLNEYLVEKSTKTSASYENDGAEKLVVDRQTEDTAISKQPSSNGSPKSNPFKKDDAKDMYKRSQEMANKAIQDSKDRTVATSNPSVGVYNENPFSP